MDPKNHFKLYFYQFRAVFNIMPFFLTKINSNRNISFVSQFRDF